MPVPMSESSAYDARSPNSPSAYDPRSPNGPRPSIDPGARSTGPNNPPDPTAMLREVTEIRSHYSLTVDRDSTPPILSIGYKIRDLSRKYTIPMTNMPLNSATSWLLYGGRGRAAVTGIFVIDTVRGAENMAQRPLSQPEAEGFALHASRRTLYMFASNITAIGIGCAMAFLGKHTMKFPFRSPKPLERYNNFPNRHIPLLKGQYARAMWHITRANVYTLVALLLLNPLYKSMGNSAMMVGLYRDTRTTEIMKTIKEHGQELTRLGSNRESKGPDGQTQQQPVPYGQNRDPDPEGSYDYTESSVTNDYNGGRDNSSNAAGDAAYTDGTTDMGMMDDETLRQREAEQSPSSSFGDNSAWRQQPPSQSQYPRSPSAGSSGNFLDEVTDDASPTAGSDPYPPIMRNASSGGSAWDHVRHGSPSSDQSNPRGLPLPGMRQKPGSSAHGLQQREQEHQRQTQRESFSYESGEADRQLAREMEQRKFDEMLDRERHKSRDREVEGTRRGFGGPREDNEGGGDREGESAWDRRRRRD